MISKFGPSFYVPKHTGGNASYCQRKSTEFRGVKMNLATRNIASVKIYFELKGEQVRGMIKDELVDFFGEKYDFLGKSSHLDSERSALPTVYGWTDGKHLTIVAGKRVNHYCDSYSAAFLILYLGVLSIAGFENDLAMYFTSDFIDNGDKRYSDFEYLKDTHLSSMSELSGLMQRVFIYLHGEIYFNMKDLMHWNFVKIYKAINGEPHNLIKWRVSFRGIIPLMQISGGAIHPQNHTDDDTLITMLPKYGPKLCIRVVCVIMYECYDCCDWCVYV